MDSSLNDGKQNDTRLEMLGAWVARSVKQLPLAQVMTWGPGIQPDPGSLISEESAAAPSPSALLPCSCSLFHILSFSQINTEYLLFLKTENITEIAANRQPNIPLWSHPGKDTTSMDICHLYWISALLLLYWVISNYSHICITCPRSKVLSSWPNLSLYA